MYRQEPAVQLFAVDRACVYANTIANAQWLSPDLAIRNSRQNNVNHLSVFSNAMLSMLHQQLWLFVCVCVLRAAVAIRLLKLFTLYRIHQIPHAASAIHAKFTLAWNLIKSHINIKCSSHPRRAPSQPSTRANDFVSPRTVKVNNRQTRPTKGSHKTRFGPNVSLRKERVQNKRIAGPPKVHKVNNETETKAPLFGLGNIRAHGKTHTEPTKHKSN